MTIRAGVGKHISDDEAVALVEKRLDRAARDRLDAHLDGCDSCREIVAAMAMAGHESDEPDASQSRSENRTAFDDSAPTQAYRRGDTQTTPLDRGDMVGHFRVMRRLGKGAMGEVYLARDTMLGRKVALKVIAPELCGSPKALKRFLFEARATARFNHPNIVQIHAVGEHESRPYVALEYVEGENLRERTKRQHLALRETLRIGLAIADALSQAHAAGILHRDLKPANVVIGADGRVRVVDFGLAKAVVALDDEDSTTTSGSSSTWLVGTPRYMAPEQWQGSDVDGAADVWALGVILFELCSHGAKPFAAESTVDLLRVVCSEDPAPELSSFVPVPQAVSRLVAGCLAKRPEARPIASQLASSLRALVEAGRDGTGAVETLALGEGPFRGLLPFAERHAPVFVGREAEVDALLERLRSQPVLPLLGPSGSGKTSLVQAGLIPRLREEERWVVLSLRPGSRPFETLAGRLGRGDPVSARASIPDVEVSAEGEALLASPRKLSLALRELAEAENAKVLLFIDQLEEVFTLASEALRDAFLEAVCTAADDADDPVRVVLALRHDFVDRLRTDGEVGAALSRFVVLRAPDRAALARILDEPVERVGYAYEDPALVEQMIAAVQGEPACLPLLSFAAQQLWEQRDKEHKRLLRSAYEAMGGVGGALARHADSLVAALSAEQRRIARSLCLRLVTPERTRRVVPRRVALDGLGASAEGVLKQLIEARLVSVSKVHGDDEPALELTHGSLVHTWKTLADWIEHGEEELRLLGEATQAAELWDRRGRRAEELWGRDALREADRQMRQNTTKLPDLVARFLAASRAVQGKRTRVLRLALAGGLVGAALIGAAVTLLLLFVARTEQAAVVAQQQAEEHEQQLREQRAGLLVQGARRALDEGHPLDARAQLRRALELADSTAARALWRRLEDEPVRVRTRLGGTHHGLSIAPDGGIIAVASHERRIYLVSTTTGAIRLLEGHSDGVSTVAFTPDGKGLVSGDLAGHVLYWDLATQVPRSLRRSGKVSVWGVAPSPDSKQIAVAGQRGLALVDVELGGLVREIDRQPAQAVVFALGGAAIVAGGADGAVTSYATDSGKRLWSKSAADQVQSLAVSADGKTLAAASRGGAILILSADGSGEPRRLERSAGSTRGLAFDARGERLAAGGFEGATEVFDVASGRIVASYRSPGRVFAAAFGAHGNDLALAGDDEVVVLALDKLPLALDGRRHEGAVNDVAFDSAGKTVASAGADGTVRLWDVATGGRRRALRGHGGGVSRVAFSPRGELLASGSLDGTVRLWDPDTGAARRLLGGHEDAVLAVGFSPDGSLLASGSRDRTVRLWRVATGAEARVLRAHTAAVTDVAFSPDGEALATASADRTIRVWPIPDGNVRTLEGHEGPVAGLAFAPYGERLVSAALDQTLRVWDLRSGTSQVVDRGVGRVQRVSFHPDGATVAAARSDGEAQLIELLGHETTRLRGHAGDVNAIAFDRTGAYAASAGADGTVRLWDVATHRAMWAGIALVPRPGRLLSHRGWEIVADGTATTVEGRWAKHLVAEAQFATQADADAPLCAFTHGGDAELWNLADDVLVIHVKVDAEQVLGLPRGCAVRSAGAVHLLTAEGEHKELAVGGDPLALGWGEGQLLVASAREVVSFSPSGQRLDARAHDGGEVTAITRIGSQLVIGRPQRNITLLGTSEAEPSSVARFVRASPSAPTRMAVGPRGTLLSGYSDGTVAVSDPVDGSLLFQYALHGRVIHLLSDDDVVYAASELGDAVRWDLRVLTADRCTVLADVWRSVPVSWEQGEAVERPAPADHPCATSGPPAR